MKPRTKPFMRPFVQPVRLARAGTVDRCADGAFELVFDADAGATADGPGVCAGGGCPGCPAGRGAGRLHLGGALREAIGTPQVGERLEVSVAAAGLRQIAVRAFGVPLAALLAGAGSGQFVGGETWSIGIGVAGFAAGLAWVRGSGAQLAGLLEFELRRPPSPGAGLDQPARSRSL